MKKAFSALALSVFVASFAQASDYQFDVSGSIANTDADPEDTNSLGLGIEFHFLPVDTSRGPLAEAAFITKSTNIYAWQRYEESDGPDSDTTNLGGEVYIPNTMFYAALDYSYVSGDESEDSWTVHAGLTPIENLLVTTSYNEDSDYDPNLKAKYLIPLSTGATLVARAQIALIDDQEDTLGAGLDYYFNRYTGIGFNFTDSNNNEELEVHVHHFFLDDAYVGLSYTDNDFADTIALSGGFRF